VPAFVIDADHGDVAGGVAGGVDGDDPAVVGERAASRKRAERAVVQLEGPGANPTGSGWRRTRRIIRAIGDARNFSSASWINTRVWRWTRPSMWSPCAWVSTTSRDVVEVQAGGGDRRKFLLGGYFHARERNVPRCRGLAGVYEP